MSLKEIILSDSIINSINNMNYLLKTILEI